jgi:flagellar protein FlaJ
VTVTTTQRLAFRYFGKQAAKSKQLPKLEIDLRKARIPVRPEAYMARVWFTSTLTAICVTAMALILFVAMAVALHIPLYFGVFVLLLPGLAWSMTFAVLLGSPASKAKGRGKQIDLKLPYATNYITAMASAGVIPAEIFKSLATQQVYGEAAREAAAIYKDLHIHGKDIVTALLRAIDRTPSVKFQDLLQGAITTITSGGDLTNYFRTKAHRLQWENRQEQQRFVETMGLMAEAYVTAAVAGPLFLLVMVAIFVLIGSGDMIILQSLVYGLIPIASLGFMGGLMTMIPEV